MKGFAVDAWAPEYGSSVEEAALVDSDVPTDVTVEVDVAGWAPRRPAGPVAAPVLFVDGVRRTEARLWITGDDDRLSHGICASYGAGVVRCDGRAQVLAAEVRRGLFTLAAGASDIVTRHATFRVVAVTDDDRDRLSLCLQQKMGELEVAVALQARADHPDELIVVDGPLRQHQHLHGAVGYIKTLHRSYGPAVVLDTATRLQPGERTPVFVVGERFVRFSWYVRLPVDPGGFHPLAGLVRCEATTDPGVEATAALADTVAASLPRFASSAHKDSRAPQNLYPIAGLEREVRRRLGDPALVWRALRAAAQPAVMKSTSASTAPTSAGSRSA